MRIHNSSVCTAVCVYLFSHYVCVYVYALSVCFRSHMKSQYIQQVYSTLYIVRIYFTMQNLLLELHSIYPLGQTSAHTCTEQWSPGTTTISITVDSSVCMHEVITTAKLIVAIITVLLT
jgi:hypothetical protein